MSIAENSLRVNDTNRLGNMNLLVVDITFLISTGNYKHGHKRVFITFPIKIPGKNIYQMNDSISDIAQHLRDKNRTIGSQSYAYKIMKERYERGHKKSGAGE